MTARSTATGRLRAAAGFTIIELMVVMTIVVTLATIAMVQYRQSVQFARESVLRDDLFKIRDAIDQYYADKNRYPSSLEDLVSAGYIRTVPKDPITNSTATWREVPAEPDPNNPTATGGMYDVKSGAEGTGLDGSRYSDW